MVHIRIDREKSPNWIYQDRNQNISRDLFMTTLLMVHNVLDGAITKDQLVEVAKSVPVPENDQFGECLPWILRVVERLDAGGFVTLKDAEALRGEFTEFAVGNRAYATSSRFPNVKVSSFCS
ncbi:hypothetical protein P691DRAFT_733905 [Macrolepiota fuliginosa MF-IS2]|uniref:Uncharacterized protein n=1 Tax=Macrolepiota fuliginosa MF-IS2 TaxID=1400762 RepID=A0A9P5X8L0_9AGAR|nr:hypothetical protein P691DRAFT_733905 [Macrolepiota fuliginosa MF-IS2]